MDLWDLLRKRRNSVAGCSRRRGHQTRTRAWLRDSGRWGRRRRRRGRHCMTPASVSHIPRYFKERRRCFYRSCRRSWERWLLRSPQPGSPLRPLPIRLHLVPTTLLPRSGRRVLNRWRRRWGHRWFSIPAEPMQVRSVSTQGLGFREQFVKMVTVVPHHQALWPVSPMHLRYSYHDFMVVI